MIQPWTDQPKISEESSVDTSGEQERRSKPLASCSGQSRTKLPHTLSVRRSPKLPQVDSHQYSQEVTSHTPESRVSKEETRD